MVLVLLNEQQNEIASFPSRLDVPIQHHGHCTAGGYENYEPGSGRGSAGFEPVGADEITEGFQDSPATLPASPRIARHQQGNSIRYRLKDLKQAHQTI